MDRLKVDIQLNQNGLTHSNDSDTRENNNNKKIRTKRKVIRKPNILDISSFDAFQYSTDIIDRHTAMEFLPGSEESGDSDEYNCVFVKLSDRTDRRFKLNQRKKTRREKIEDLRNRSIKKCGNNTDENALYTNMLESYEEVLGDDLYEDSKLMNDKTADPCKLCNLRTLSEREREAFMRRDLVLTELADSEKNYLEDLEFIVTKYHPLMTEENITEELLKNLDNIYMNISEIYQFHLDYFQSKIEECFENPDLLNDTFSQHEEQLTQLYTFYCSQKPFADEYLNTHESELDALCKNKFPDVKLRIKDYLIKPVQRLMKYQLLLSSIKKYGVKAGKGPTYLDISIQVMERVPKEANDAMHVGLITGYNGHGCNVQQLMTHGELDVSVGKTKPRSMHVFLFEHVLIFTEKAEKLVPEYKCIDSQDTGTLGFTDNKNTKFVIWFRKHNKTDIYVCEAESEELKEEWKDNLNHTVGLKEIHNRRRSCRRQLTIEITPPCPEKASSYGDVETLMIEEAVIKAMAGHPRLGIMTERLKSNIEKYIASEFIIPKMESKHGRHLNRSKTNPSITVPSKTLAVEDPNRRDSTGRSPSPNSLSKYSIKRFNMSPNLKKKDTKNKEGTYKKSRTKSIY